MNSGWGSWSKLLAPAAQGLFTVAENKDVECQRNHAVAETEEALRALLLGAAAMNSEPLSFLLPVRRQSFFVGA